MAGARYHFRRFPAVAAHDAERVAGVLHGVPRRGSSSTAEAGMPCASAVRAITCASTKRLATAPPVKMMRDATPRSYSCTASVTRASSRGLGFPSASAGVPSTMSTSKWSRVVLLTRASARSMAAQAISPRISAAQAKTPRANQPSRRRLFGAGLRLALRVPVCFCDFVEFNFRDFAEFNRARLQTPL